MKTITVGDWDGEQRQVQVEDNATLNDALVQAGVNVARTQRVTSYSNAATVGMNDPVSDGEVYLLTSNHVSG